MGDSERARRMVEFVATEFRKTQPDASLVGSRTENRERQDDKAAPNGLMHVEELFLVKFNVGGRTRTFEFPAEWMYDGEERRIADSVSEQARAWR